VERADDVDLGFAGLCASLDDIQQRPFFGACEVKPAFFQDRTKLFLLFDRDELGREKDGCARGSWFGCWRRFGWSCGWGFSRGRGCLDRGGCGRRGRRL
jgi:hypothetical protein